MSDPWSVQQDVIIAFSFIGFVLVSIPLYWHLEAWNVGCILYIFWTGSQCLIQFIGMNIWKDNAINWAPVWCDITSRWMLASSTGICAASLVINRRLYNIATIATVGYTKEDKRRMALIDLGIGLGIPVLQVALYWFIQGHRFNIIEGYGCTYAIPNTILSYFLYDCWPLVIGLASMVYCSLVLRAFLKRRKQMSELVSSNRNLSLNRYLRLMGLATVQILFTVPLTIWVLVDNSQEPMYEWQGLENLHYGFSAVLQVPAVVWRADPLLSVSINFNMWSIIFCALIFFAFFGLAEEARRHYSVALSTVARRVGISTTFHDLLGSRNTSRGSSSKPSTSVLANITIPSFLQRPSKRSSITSFSTRLSTSISLEPYGDDEKPLPDVPGNLCSMASFSQHATDEKVDRDILSPPPLAVVRPDYIVDISSSIRPSPDVPLSVSSIDHIV